MTLTIKKIFFYILLSLMWGQAHATTITTNMTVTATVTSVCTVAANTLTFASYNFSANSTASTTVTAQCTNGIPYHIRLGTGAGATVIARLMTRTGHADTLNYGLYRDAALTQNWGQTDNTDTIDVTSASGTAQIQTVYGSIASRAVPVGIYNDTVVVTVSY